MLKKLLVIAIVPAVLLAFAYFGSTAIVMYSFDQVVHFKSPYTASLPAAQPSTPMVKQVVLVVIDGLRDDVAQQLPTFTRLAGQGAMRTLRVGQPSLSVPAAATISTGSWQEQNGVTTNWYAGAALVDSIFARSQAAGLKTAVAGASEWTALFPGQFDATAVVDWQNEASDDAVIDGALRLLAERKPDLLLVHVSSVDEAGHAQGGASAEYRRVALATDGRVARLLSQVDLSKTVFIITADHGHINSGGHGGPEPVVLNAPFAAAGPGIAAGRYPQGGQADLAPTLAVLLGTAIPANNQGHPLWDMLQLSDQQRAQRSVDVAGELSGVYTVYERVVGASAPSTNGLDAARAALARNDYSAAFQAANSYDASLEAGAAQARTARLWRERLARTPATLLLLLPFAAWLYFARRQRWDLRASLLGAVLYFVLYNVLFFARGNTYSLSAFNSEDQIQSFFTQRGMEALIVLLLAALLVAFLARRRDWFGSALAQVNLMFLVALGLALQLLLFYWLWNVSFSWYLPDLALGFKYYGDMIQTTAFYPLVYLPVAALLPLIGVAAGGLTRALTRRPAGGSRPSTGPLRPRG